MTDYTRPIFALLTKIARARRIQLPPYTGSDFLDFNRRMFEEVLAPALGFQLPPLSGDPTYREMQTYVLLRRAAASILPPKDIEKMPVLPAVTFGSGGGVDLPRVSFTQITHPSIVESAASSEVVIVLTVENASTANLDNPWYVGLTYTPGVGGAVYNDDFKIFQEIGGQIIEAFTQVNFAPQQTNAAIRLRVVDDGVSEALETWRIQLVPNAGCTLGSIPETSGVIIDDDVMPGGQGLRPQFYFQSEVFGKGPNSEAGNRANMIVDLGPGISFTEDVLITVDSYSPAPGKPGSAVESLDGGLTGDYWFPDGKILTIEAGERYGKLQFRVTDAGVAESLKWVVVEMTGTNYGSIDDFEQSTRWVAVLTGANDTEGLIPPVVTPPTSLDDYKVYANYIEDWAHPISPGVPFVINLPYNRNQPGLETRYDQDLRNAVVEDGANVWNGVAIAAHLAQKVWLDRNNPIARTFGTRQVFRSGLPGQHEIHWIEPHVKWLDIGVPVYISVYENALNGPHDLLFAGSFDSPSFGAIGSVMWGRHYSTGTVGLAHPSCTRDLYITARNHQHKLKFCNFGAFGVNFNAPVPGEQWHKASFMDNVHLTGFRIEVGFDNPPVGGNTRRVLGIFPPRNTKLWRVTHGLIYIDQWDWVADNVNAPGTNGFDFAFRTEEPGSWIITNCTGTRAERQMFYLDATGPICLIAHNNLPTGTGRSFLQIVSRPPFCTIPLDPMVSDGRNSGGPSHGLLAVVENEIYGDRRWTDASDMDIYGHTGELYIVGNRHRGDAGSAPGFQSSRRIYSILASGDFAGIYVFDPALADLACEFHPDYPLPFGLPVEDQRFFAFRYVEIAKMDHQCNGTGQVSNNMIQVGGCFRFKFLPVLAATPTPAMGGIPFIAFNSRYAIRPDYPGLTWPGGSPGGGAVLADVLLRPVLGAPYGPPDKTANRGGYYTQAGPGSIKFPAGFDESIGQACGSIPIADHATFSSAFNQFTIFASLSAGQRDAYDGRDFDI